jgi:aminoglycoside 6-adenylyltransferase
MTDSLIEGMDQLEESFTAWAKPRKDIRAAIVVGSRARTDHPADEWADLTAAFMTTDPVKYHANTGWIQQIAPVWAIHRDPTGVTYHELFDGGRDAGIAVIPARPVRLATLVVPTLRRVPGVARALPFGLGRKLQSELEGASGYYRRGARLLFDKDGAAARFLAVFPPAERAYQPPPPDVFSGVVDEFWIGAMWAAKHLWRGEVWYARCVGYEGTLREAILKMVEWNAQGRSEGTIDTWGTGRFIEEWASDRILSNLKTAFSGYDASSLQQSLEQMMTFFDRLSAETAEHLGYAYSTDLPERVTSWISTHKP